MTQNVQSHPHRLCHLLLLACVVIVPAHRLVASAPDLRPLETKAPQGYIRQQIQLAEAYFTGNGTPRYPGHAAYWYQKAAESGNPEAQNLPQRSQTVDAQATLWVQQRRLSPGFVQSGGKRRLFSDPPRVDTSDGLRASGLALPAPAS
jgi:hypothetical protein